MGRFLTGLSWSQPVAFKAHALGMGLDDVQALVESRDAVVEHTRLHQYVFSLDGVRVIVDSRAWQILSVEAEHVPPRVRMREPEVSSLDGWGFTDTARESIYRLGVTGGEVLEAIDFGEWLPAEQMRTICRYGRVDVVVSEATNVVIAVLPAGAGRTLSRLDSVPRAVGTGAPVGSVPQDVHDLIRRAERAGLIVTQASTNHYKIWQDQEGVGAPVVIPSTGSDNYRGFRNAVMEIRSRFGIDLREY